MQKMFAASGQVETTKPKRKLWQNLTNEPKMFQPKNERQRDTGRVRKKTFCTDEPILQHRPWPLLRCPGTRLTACSPQFAVTHF